MSARVTCSVRASRSALSAAGRLAIAAAVLVAATGCAALVVSGATGGAGSGQDDRRMADAGISSRVLSAFRADPLLRNQSLRVTTESGIVTLAGSVPDYRIRAQAEALAAGVSGVTGIRNEIKVPGGQPRP